MTEDASGMIEAVDERGKLMRSKNINEGGKKMKMTGRIKERLRMMVV